VFGDVAQVRHEDDVRIRALLEQVAERLAQRRRVGAVGVEQVLRVRENRDREPWAVRVDAAGGGLGLGAGDQGNGEPCRGGGHSGPEEISSVHGSEYRRSSATVGNREANKVRPFESNLGKFDAPITPEQLSARPIKCAKSLADPAGGPDDLPTTTGGHLLVGE
jgi:hypothetical protein